MDTAAGVEPEPAAGAAAEPIDEPDDAPEASPPPDAPRARGVSLKEHDKALKKVDAQRRAVEKLKISYDKGVEEAKKSKEGTARHKTMMDRQARLDAARKQLALDEENLKAAAARYEAKLLEESRKAAEKSADTDKTSAMSAEGIVQLCILKFDFEKLFKNTKQSIESVWKEKVHPAFEKLIADGKLPASDSRIPASLTAK